MVKKIISRNYFYLLVILILCLWQGRYLLGSGFYTFSDESHLANLHQMISAFKSGQFPPRWAPNFSYNFGHPFFNFYYLLPYYVGSFFYFTFRMSLIWSLKSVFFLSLVASGIAMYYLSLKFFDKLTSLSISVLYLFTPYRAVDLYVRGAVGELFGFIFMPLVLLTFLNLLKSNKSSSLFWATISLFGLIISHNLTVLIFLPLLFTILTIYILRYISVNNRLAIIIRVAKAFIISILLSSFYLIPAIFEKKYMQSGTPFNPLDHFPFIKQLIIPYWGYGASVWGPTDELSFQIGIVNLLSILLVSIIFIFLKFKYKAIASCLIIIFFFSLFMMNIRSWPLWQIIPISSYVQFPWRFLIITTFTSSLLLGFTSFIKLPFIRNIPIFLALLSILTTFSYFKPHKLMSVTDDYYLTRFFINQNTQNNPSIISSIYKNNSEDYLPLTVWTSKRPSSLPPKINTPPEISISNYKIKSEINYTFETESETGGQININNYYFPGWKALIDNKLQPIFPFGQEGSIGLDIPAGNHQINLNFTNTPIRTFANLISLTTLSLFIIKIFREKLS